MGCPQQKQKTKKKFYAPFYSKHDETKKIFPQCSVSAFHIQQVGTRWHSWLRPCATSRKVAGSIPDGVIGIFDIIPRISRNPKDHYRTHKRPPPVPILGQPYPVHIPTSHLLEIHRNIIHPSMPRSPHWSPSLQFPQIVGYLCKSHTGVSSLMFPVTDSLKLLNIKSFS